MKPQPFVQFMTGDADGAFRQAVPVDHLSLLMPDQGLVPPDIGEERLDAQPGERAFFHPGNELPADTVPGIGTGFQNRHGNIPAPQGDP